MHGERSLHQPREKEVAWAALTDEDQPPTLCCEKTCVKTVVLPPAFIAHVAGCFLLWLVWRIERCGCSCVGPGFFMLFWWSKAAAAQGTATGAYEAFKGGIRTSVGLARCLLVTVLFARSELIGPHTSLGLL
mmetsp:Transcript_58516/g.116032  ORF Transcript_58516/g.116032 Transcript_58516/m.116032 type:complete len:132 (+) Transcript_58516:3376-3771(+)